MTTHTSSFVFVGGQFPLTLFDERQLFNGQLDDEQTKVGQVAQFSYQSGKCRFELTPVRVDLKYTDCSILPPPLVGASEYIAAELESVRRALRVSGVGINCDTVFERSTLSMSGDSFCSKLLTPMVMQLTQTPELQSLPRVRFSWDTVIYDIRIEPHTESQGQNLFVSINGHQNVQDEPLAVILNRADSVRAYIDHFHQRVLQASRSC